MAVIGCLGDIVFQVSDQTVVTMNNWKWSGAAKYAVHERHGLRPLTELTGVEPDKITFEIQLRAELGVSPNKEAVKIWWYERKGTPLPLTIGKYAYGFTGGTSCPTRSAWTTPTRRATWREARCPSHYRNT